MNRYVEFELNIGEKIQQELLIAQLSEIGFDGFEELPNILKAFIKDDLLNAEQFEDLMSGYPEINFSKKIIEDKNWNEQWESSFEPVLIDDIAAVRASFHAPIPQVKYQIIITPKMSFGTGHHATTYLMMQQMALLDFKNKQIIDFGTGTGVLAIFAEMLGAAHIEAVDNDSWSIDNAKENIEENKAQRITLALAETINFSTKADIILANINRNVILHNLDAIINCSKQDTIVLFSGLLVADKEIMVDAFDKVGLTVVDCFEKNNWLAIKTEYTQNL